MMRFLAFALICLPAFAFQNGSDTVSGNLKAVFRMEPLGFQIGPERQVLLMENPEASVFFEYSYDGEVSDNMRIEGTLVSPSGDQTKLSQAYNLGRIMIHRDQISEEGSWQLTNLALLDGDELVAEGQPDVVTIDAVSELLVSRATVEELSRDELEELGFVFNKDDYRAVKFNLSLVVGATEVPIRVPVLLPVNESDTWRSPKVIPDPFLPAKILTLWPDPPGNPKLSFVGEESSNTIAADPAKVLSLVVIPGKIHHLKSMFRIAVVTMNAAPDGVDVSVENLKAKIQFPHPTKYGHPLSLIDPENGGLERGMIYVGEDGQSGTWDDRDTIEPNQEATAEYYVRGNVPGIHDVTFDITGTATAGPDTRFAVTSQARGRVYVRNPEYTVTFEHPEVIAKGEPYDLTMHIKNVGAIALTDFHIAMDPYRLVGVTMLAGTNPTQSAGDIPPGGEAALTWGMRADATGQVVASYYRVEEGISSSLQLSVGIAPTGERLASTVLSFPTEFNNHFEADLRTPLVRFAKKLFDLSHMVEEELPGHLLPLSGSVAKAFNQELAFAGTSIGLGANSEQAHISLMRTVIGAMGGVPAIDRFRREAERLSEPDLDAAFEPFLRNLAAGRSGRDLLEWMGRENRDCEGLALVLVEGAPSAVLQAQDLTGRVVATDGAVALPLSAWFDLGDGRYLAWLGGVTGSITITPSGVAGSDLRCQAVFNRNGTDDLVYFDSGTWTPAVDPLLVLQPESLRWDIEEAGALREVPGERVPWTPFGIVGVKHLSPVDHLGVDSHGRQVAFMFNKPLSLSAISDFSAHLSINGRPAVTGQVQNDRRFLIVKAALPLGPYRTNRYTWRDLTAEDGSNLALVEGTFQGDAFFRGVSVRGRVVDRAGSNIQDATVNLLLLPTSSDGHPPRYVLMDKVNPDADGNYSFDFVPVRSEGIPIPAAEDNPFTFDRDLYERFVGYLKAKSEFHVVVQLADGRYERRKFIPQAPGQEVVAEFSFLNLGSIYGQVTADDGTPITDTQVYAVNEDPGRDFPRVTPQLVPTDENGMYRIDGLEVGRVLLKTRARDGRLAYRSVFLTREESPLRVDLTFGTVSADITGRITQVVDGEDLPLANAVVGWWATGTTPLSWRPYPDSPGELLYNAMTRTDENGVYFLDDVPAGVGKLWVLGERNFRSMNITVGGNQEFVQDLRLVEPTPTLGGVIRGQVVDYQGFPLEGIPVSAGAGTVSGPDGRFELTVSVYPMTELMTVSAVQSEYDRNGVWIPRAERLRGKATISISSDRLVVEDVLIIALRDPRVSGSYLDVAGNPIPFAPIYNPPDDGLKRGRPFAYTDHEGKFSGSLFDTSKFPGQYWDPHLGLQTGANLFTGYRFPKLAETEVTVGIAGYENVVVQEEPQSKVRVRLVDGEGAPVIGRVNVEGFLPSNNKETMGMVVQGRLYSVLTDTDGYAFFDPINIRETTIYGQHPLLGETNHFKYTPTVLGPDDEVPTVVLAYSSQNEPTNLYGRIFASDGVSPAAEGTLVTARVGGLQATTRTNPEGWYWFDTLVTTETKQFVDMVVYHPESTDWAAEKVYLDREMRFRHDMILSGRNSVLVRVVDSYGALVETGNVTVSYSDVLYQEPTAVDEFGETRIEPIVLSQQVLPTQQALLFENLPAGDITLKAIHGNGLTALKSVALPRDGRQLEIYLRLETPASISGVFYDNLGDVIPEGEIQLRHNNALLQQRVTAAEDAAQPGAFLFDALPMRQYTLTGRDPDTSLSGTLEVQPTPYNPDPIVRLQVDPVGHIDGILQWEGEPLGNTRLTILDDNGEFSGRKVRFATGTDEFGHIDIRNLPLGKYVIYAHAQVGAGEGTGRVSLVEAGQTATVDIQFRPTHDLELTVLQADGLPAAFTQITIRIAGGAYFNGTTGFTDENGVVKLRNLDSGYYVITGREQRYAMSLFTPFSISPQDPAEVSFEVQFPGVGTVSGQVVDEFGVPIGFPVTVRFLDKRVESEVWRKTDTDAAGFFYWDRVPLNTPMIINAVSNRNLESETARFEVREHLEHQEVTLVMRRMTSASGQVVFPGGAPVPYAKVWTKEPQKIIGQADAAGYFTLDPVSTGVATIFAKDPFSPRTASLGIVTEYDGDDLPVPHQNLLLELQGVGTLSGDVALSDGTPLAFGTVQLTHQETGAVHDLSLFADGSWFQSQLPIGTYRLRSYDVERRTWAEDEPEITLAGDGDSGVIDLVFQPSYEVRGRVLAPGRLEGIENALVELWMNQGGGNWARTHHNVSFADGFYFLEHVYPGTYRILIQDELREHTLTSEITVTGDRDDADYELMPTRSLNGVVVDGNNVPLYPGFVSIHAIDGGPLASGQLDQSGAFRLNDIGRDQVLVKVSCLRGWFTFEQVVNLAPGDNNVAFTGPETVEVRGRLVVQSEDVITGSAGLVYRGRSRGRTVNIDGSFAVNRVPVGEPMTLYVSARSSSRNIEVGPFTADTDLGDIMLDLMPPELPDFPDGIQINTMPGVVRIPINEDEADSAFDPSKTQVWLNDISVQSALVYDDGAVVLRFDSFPHRAVRGRNLLKLVVANTAGTKNFRTYECFIDPPGVTLDVDLVNNATPTGMDAWLEQGAVIQTDEHRHAYFHGLAPGVVRLWARNGVYGAFQEVTIPSGDPLVVKVKPNIFASAAVQGQVRDADGEPLAGVRVWQGNQPTVTELDGTYRMWPYRLGQSGVLHVNESQGVGYVDTPHVTQAGSTVYNQDIEVAPTGALVGTVTDSDGVKPATDVTVSLYHDDLPEVFQQVMDVDSEGRFAFERVPVNPLRLVARQKVGARAGFAEYSGMQPGQTVTLQVQLEPVGQVAGRLLDRDGAPVAAAPVKVVGRRGSVYAEGQTGADGRFTLTEVSYGDFTIDGESQSHLGFVKQAFTLDQGSLELGDLTLQDDQPPSLTVTLAEVWDPLLRPGLNYQISDDRRLASLDVVVNAFPELQVTKTVSGLSSGSWISLPVPDDITYGVYPMSVTVTDHFGQTTTWQGDLNVADDITPPTISLLSPQDVPNLEEGAVFRLVVDVAKDAHDVAVEYQGADLIAGYGAFNGTVHEYDVRVPPVTASGRIEIDVLARDLRGNQARLAVPIDVIDRTFTGTPSLVSTSHFDGQPMPLNLNQPLVLDLRAEAADPDGLQRAWLYIDDVLVYETTLVGETQTLAYRYQLPSATTPRTQLAVRWEVDDMGFNRSVQTVTLQHIDGEIYDENNPLAISRYSTIYDNRSLILVGGVHVIDGRHNLTNLIMVNGAKVQLSRSSDTLLGDAAVTALTVSGAMVVDVGTRISADAKGFPQAALYVGGNHTPNHGGLTVGETDAAQAFGSVVEPMTVAANSGGGALFVDAARLTVSGVISADGFYTGNLFGAGGSIWLNSDQLEGYGEVRANGYVDYDAPAHRNTAGGRIAIYGHGENLRLRADGRGYAGHGTLFLKIPDSAYADGTRDVLRVQGRARGLHHAVTPLPMLRGVVGEDLTFLPTQQGPDGYRDKLITATSFGYDLFKGLYVWREGEPENRVRIDRAVGNELVSEPDQAFPVFQNGDVVHVGYPFDLVEVLDDGRLGVSGTDWDMPLLLEKGTLATTAGQTLDLSGVPLSGTQVQLDGDFRMDQLTVAANRTVSLNGSLTSENLTVAEGGILRSLNVHPAPNVAVTATTITVDGEITVAANKGFANPLYGRHGGLRPSTDQPRDPKTSGSLYRPAGFAGGDGGMLHLTFDSLTLNGAVTLANGEVAGGALLEGRVLQGSGPLRADGGVIGLSSGYGSGGRLALVVDDLDGFDGLMTTYGHPGYGEDNRISGAGTIFIKTAADVDGRLIVDNGGRQAPLDHTVLPVFGTRTAGEGTTTTSVVGDFPADGEYVGMYVQLEGQEPQAIVAQTPTALTLAGEIAGLSAGVSLTAFHRFDEIVSRGGATVYTSDIIRVSRDPVLDGGAINAPIEREGGNGTRTFADGAGELTVDDGTQIYELDNFQLVVHFPLDVTRVTLRNGASLTYNAGLRAQVVNVDAATLFSGVDGPDFGLVAETVTLTNNALWTARPHTDTLDPARINADVSGTLTVDATSAIVVGGDNGGGRNVAPNRPAHAGFERISDSFRTSFDRPVRGSFMQPTYRVPRGGGAMRLRCATLDLAGRLETTRLETSNSQTAAGSIWLEADQFLGSGRINSGVTGGRVAIYHSGDASFLARYDVVMHPTQTSGLLAGGTLFVKGANQQYGELFVSQNPDHLSSEESLQLQTRLTGLTGPATLTITSSDQDPDPLVVHDPAWTDVMPGLAGLWVRFSVNGTDYETQVRDNDGGRLLLAAPASGTLPDTLPLGTELNFVVKLDRLTLRHGAQLHFAGDMELGELVLDESDQLASLWVRDLKGLPDDWTLRDRKLRLTLDQPSFDGKSITLENSELWLDKPITLTRLTMVNSAVKHSPNVVRGESHFYRPGIHLTVGEVTMDAQSRFADSGYGQWSPGDLGYTNHGGTHRSSDPNTYGSLFEPDLPGAGVSSAGGRIFLQTPVLNGGTFDVSSKEAAGSIWLEVGTVTGAVHFNAGRDGNSGGGGRIAMVYDDISQAQITTDTRCTFSSGTYFSKERAAEFGTLVIDNGEFGQAGERVTVLPTFAPVTLDANFYTSQENGTTRLWLPGLELSDWYRGYHVAFNDDTTTLFRIGKIEAGEGGTALHLAGTLPALSAGDRLEPVVRLANLDLCSGCQLAPAELKIITDNSYAAGHVFRDGEQNFVEPPQVADGHLQLDGFTMEIQQAVSYDRVTLRNGASLRLVGDSNQIGTLDLDGGSLTIPLNSSETPTLSAGDITLTGTALLQAAYVTVSGTLTVGPDAVVQGLPFEGATFRWGSKSVYDAEQIIAGGLPTYPVADLIYGDFRRPWYPVPGLHRLRVNADRAVIDGTLWPGAKALSSGSDAGGTLWLDVDQLAGQGRIHADAPAMLSSGAGAGGRVAVYYRDNNAWQGVLSARGSVLPNAYNISQQTGAGTVFTKADAQAYGELTVVGNDRLHYAGATPLPGLGRVTLSDQVVVDGNQLVDPNAVFANGLAGATLVIDEDGNPQTFVITDNTATSITVDQPLPALSAGTVITAQLHLDAVQVDKGGRLWTPDHLVIHGQFKPALENRDSGDLWCRRLTLPTDTLTLDQGALGLRIDETTNLRSINVSDATLVVNGALALEQLTLGSGATLTHTALLPASQRKFSYDLEGLHLQVNALSVAADAAVNVAGKGYESYISGLMARSHGGLVSSGAYTYGSPFEPQLPGTYGGGGIIKIFAQSIQLDGALNASGYVGGSIWLNTATIAGAGTITVDSAGLLDGSNHGSAGRIALYYDDNQLVNLPTARSTVRENFSDAYEQAGAGTVYLRQRNAADGALYLINRDLGTKSVLATPLAAVGSHTLTETPADARVLVQSGANWRPGLEGMEIVDQQTNEVYRIVAHTKDSLTLDRPVVPAPSAGWAYRGRAPIDRVYTGWARLVAADAAELDAQVTDNYETDAPVIDAVSFSLPLANAAVAGSPFQMDLAASDLSGIAAVSVTFDGQTQNGSGQGPWTFNWTAPNVTVATDYSVAIEISDSIGNTRREQRALAVWPVDSELPVVTVESPAENTSFDSDVDVTTRVSVTDNYGLARVVYQYGDETRTVNVADKNTNAVDEQVWRLPTTVGDQTVTLTIEAYDLSEQRGSTTLNLTVRDTTPPPPPLSVAITPTTDSLSLTWPAVDDSAGDLAGYELELVGVQAALSLAADVTSHQFTGLTPDTAYQVRLATRDASGNLSTAYETSATTLSDAGVAQIEAPDAWWSFDRDNATQTAVSFSGSNSGAVVTPIRDLGRDSAGLTLATWFRLDSTSSSKTLIALTPGEGYYRTVELYTSSNRLYFTAYRGQGSNYSLSWAGLTAGRWHRAVATVDFAGNVMNLYLDGVQVQSRTLSGTGNSADVRYSGVTLGRRANNQYYLPGAMRDAQVWRTAWSPDDAVRDWQYPGSATDSRRAAQHGFTLNPDYHLVGAWPMDGRESDRLVDLSRNQSHAIPAGNTVVNETLNLFAVADRIGSLPGAAGPQRVESHGDFGSALVFDGNQETLPWATPVWSGPSFASSILIRLDQLPSALGRAMTVYQLGAASLTIDTQDRLVWQTRDGAVLTADSALQSGRWYQVTTLRQNGDTHQLLLDGAVVASAALTDATQPDGAWTLAGSAAGNDALVGAVDEWVMWSTQPQSSALAQLGGQTLDTFAFAKPLDAVREVRGVVDGETVDVFWQADPHAPPVAAWLVSLAGGEPARLGAEALSHRFTGVGSGRDLSVTVQAETRAGELSRPVTWLGFSHAGQPASETGPAPRLYLPFESVGSVLNTLTFPDNDAVVRMTPPGGLVKDSTVLTFSAWVRAPKEVTSGDLFYLGNPDVNVAPLRVFFSSGRIAVAVQPVRGFGAKTSYSSTYINDGALHRVVVVIDFIQNQVNIYLDGEFERNGGTAVNTPGPITTDNVSTMTLGGHGKTTSAMFKGELADVQLWRAAWDADDVAFDYANPIRDALQTTAGSALVPRDSLLLRSIYDQADGNTVWDRSGSGLHGSATTASWPGNGLFTTLLDAISGQAAVSENLALDTGKFGQAAVFNGESRVAFTVPAGSTDNGFSLSWWYRLPALGQDGVLLAQSDADQGLEIGIDLDARPWLKVGPTLSQSAGAALSPGVWHHFAVTADSSQGTRLFLDGRPVARLAQAPTITAQPWRLGHHSRHAGGLNGALDDLVLWDQVLDPSFITRLQQQGDDERFGDLFEVAVNTAEISSPRVTALMNSLRFDWQAPAAGLAEISGYRVYRDGAASGIFVAAPITTHLWDGLTPDSAHAVRITTVDRYGNESAGTSLQGWTAADTQVQSQPADPSSWYDFEYDGLSQNIARFPQRGGIANFSDTSQPGLVGAEAVTVAAWFRMDSARNGWQHMFHILSSNNQDVVYMDIYTGAPYFRARAGSTRGTYSISSAPRLDDGRWHRYVGVADFANQRLRLYVDGVLIEEKTANFGAAVMEDATSLNQFRVSIDSSYYYSGDLWNLQVWRGAFDDQAASLDYRDTLQTVDQHPAVTNLTADDLVLHWRLDDGADGTVTDTSGQERHGIASNLAWLAETNPVNLAYDRRGSRHLALASGVPASQGVVGAGIVVNESDLGAVITADKTIDLTGAFALSTWFQPQAGANQGARRVLTAAGGNLTLVLNADNQLVLGAGTEQITDTRQSLEMDRWYHLVLSGEPGQDVVLYVDGHRAGQLSLAAEHTLAQGPVIFGGRIGQTSTIAAAFDQVGLWATRLATDQVNWLLQNPAGAAWAKQKAPTVVATPPFAATPQPTDETPAALPLGPVDDTEIIRGDTVQREVYQTGNHLVLDGATLELNGSLIAQSIELRNGSRLTHPTLADGSAGVLVIAAAERIEIDRSSTVDLDGRGWQQRGDRFNPAHAVSGSGENGGTVYGSLLQPTTPGGGKQGGGAVLLIAPEIILDGQIVARGLGYASGGSVWLQTADLSGAGLIDVGGGRDENGAGGAGRIAIHADRTYRFAGTLTNGLTNQAAILLADSRGDNCRLVARFPELDGQAHYLQPVLPPALNLAGDAFSNVRFIGSRLVAEVTTDVDLGQYLGLSARTPQGSARLAAVSKLVDDRWVVEISGDGLNPNLLHLDFFIRVTNADQLVPAAGALPVQLQ